MRLKYACSVAAVVGGGVVLSPTVCEAPGARRRWSRLHAAMALRRACVLCGVAGGSWLTVSVYASVRLDAEEGSIIGLQS